MLSDGVKIEDGMHNSNSGGSGHLNLAETNPQA